MTRCIWWLAILYVGLLPFGRASLPLNGQWGDLFFPALGAAAFLRWPQERWLRKADWPLAAYLAVTLLAALVSVDPRTGLAHLAKQVYVATIFVVFRRLAQDPALTRQLQRTLIAVLVGVTTASLTVLFFRVPTSHPISALRVRHTLPLLGRVERLQGTFETPEFFGNALVLAFVLALGFRASATRWPRIAWTAAAALLAAAEFLTYSHSVAGFSVAAFLVLSAGTSWRSLRWAGGMGAAAIVVVVNLASVVDPAPRAVPANNYSVRPISINLFGLRVEGGLVHYAALKQVAWSAFLDHPVKGIGPGRFRTETERAFQEARLTARYRDKVPQCDLMGRLAETGLLGGLSLLLLWASWLRRLWPDSSFSQPVWTAAYAAMAGILVNSLNADVMNFRLLWVALAWVWNESSSGE